MARLEPPPSGTAITADAIDDGLSSELVWARMGQGVNQMSKFMLRREVNKENSILHAINFLIACKTKSLEDSRPMILAFHSRGEDVVVDIPDALERRFMDAMDAVDFRYEKL